MTPRVTVSEVKIHSNAKKKRVSRPSKDESRGTCIMGPGGICPTTPIVSLMWRDIFIFGHVYYLKCGTEYCILNNILYFLRILKNRGNASSEPSSRFLILKRSELFIFFLFLCKENQRRLSSHVIFVVIFIYFLCFTAFR